MNLYTIKDIATSTERYKIYTLMCGSNELNDCIGFIRSENINVLNIGFELATYLHSLEDYRYLNIDVYDYAITLFDKYKSKINSTGNDIIAFYNLGILLEPALKINVVQLLKDVSKSIALILIWDNQSDSPNRLTWTTQKRNIFLDFSETQLKKLQYAI
jgi:hypothetical protein